MADTKLAMEIGTEVAKMVHAELDEISAAVRRDAGQVSFSVTCAFVSGADGELQCRLTPRKRIPLRAETIKCHMQHGQLTLFESPPVDERGEPDVGGDFTGSERTQESEG